MPLSHTKSSRGHWHRKGFSPITDDVQARFFVDETDLALGQVLDDRLGGIVYPGHAQLPEVPRGTKDEEWLDVVGSRSLVIITRDNKIRYRRPEKQMWINRRVRGFVLTGSRSQSTDTSLEVLAGHWNEIVKLVTSSRPGPWMFTVTTRELKEITLAGN